MVGVMDLVVAVVIVVAVGEIKKVLSIEVKGNCFLSIFFLLRGFGAITTTKK